MEPTFEKLLALLGDAARLLVCLGEFGDERATPAPSSACPVALRISTILTAEGDDTGLKPVCEFPVRALSSACLLEAGGTKVLDQLADFPRHFRNIGGLTVTGNPG